MSVISGRTNRVVATVKVGNNPVGIAADSNTGIIYVANLGNNTLSVLGPCHH